MKVRDSGMPPQDYWETLFDVPGVLDAFGFGPATVDVAELGCGYGTFTLPLARRIGGTVHTVDIDPKMVAVTAQRATEAGIANVKASTRDVLAGGFGVPGGSCDAALLFNILHAEEPVELLRAARAAVKPGGLVAVIHWRSDVATPRGPSLDIRPRPERIVAWAGEAGLGIEGGVFLLPPWHFGLKLQRPGLRNNAAGVNHETPSAAPPQPKGVRRGFSHKKAQKSVCPANLMFRAPIGALEITLAVGYFVPLCGH